MNRDNLVIIGDRLSNMPPLYELEDRSSRQLYAPLIQVIEAQDRYITDLTNIVIRIFNELTALQDHKHD